MKKVFLSLPMHDRKDEDIQFTIEKMKSVVKAMYPNEEIEFVNNFHCEFSKIESVSENEKRLYYLGEAIKRLGTCDAIAFLDIRDMWELRSPGCRIEMTVAEGYGIEAIPLVDPHGKIYVPDLWKKHVEMLKEQEKNWKPRYGNYAGYTNCTDGGGESNPNDEEC